MIRYFYLPAMMIEKERGKFISLLSLLSDFMFYIMIGP
jgi:hypothetical protein